MAVQRLFTSLLGGKLPVENCGLGAALQEAISRYLWWLRKVEIASKQLDALPPTSWLRPFWGYSVLF